MIDQRSLEIINQCKDFIAKGDKVLDLGSGTGWVAKHLSDLLDIQIQCVDVVNEHRVNLPFLVYNGRKLPFSDNSFDIVLLIYTLHHCDDPIQVLKESKRVCKKRIIILEDTYTNFFGKTLAIIFDYLSNKMCNPKVKTPFNFKKVSQWLNIFEKLNLKVIYTKKLPASWRYPVRHIQFVLKKNF
jgi:ubiquinone/menaquinone biosynthesis C-methylase UbiE